MAFIRATKKQAKLRMAITGPAGAGKTFTALKLASLLAEKGQKIAVIDTEHGSASKYADLFSFDACELTNFNPKNYIDAIHEAEKAGYAVIVIDSTSHAWNGTGGVLEVVEAASTRLRGNSYAGWKEGTPLQNSLVEAIIASKCHVIATMRSKMEHVQEKDDRGKTIVRKLGMAPVQREGMEYEFDVVGDLDVSNTMVITKTRCSALTDAVIKKPGKELAKTLKAWLTDGAEPVETAPSEQPKLPPTESAQSVPPPHVEQEGGVSDDTLAVDLALSLIKGAKNSKELSALIPSMKELPESQKAAVRAKYDARKKELIAADKATVAQAAADLGGVVQ